MTLLLLAIIAVFGYACFNEGRKELKREHTNYNR